LRIARGEVPDWRALFADFEATVDFPACVYYAQLLSELPWLLLVIVGLLLALV